MRRTLWVLAAAGSLLFSLSPPAGAQAPGGALLIESRGSGHGVGMAQDGALALGLAGASAADILATFYPGTTIGKASGTLAVPVLEPAGPVVVSFPSGGEVRDSPSGGQSAGFPVTVSPGGSVQLSFDGGNYHATPQDGAAVARPPVSEAPAPAAPATPPPDAVATPTTLGLLGQVLTGGTAPPSAVAPAPAAPEGPTELAAATPEPEPTEAVSGRSLWAIPKGDSTVAVPGGASYRGRIEASAAGGGLRLVDHVDVERYLQGMGEVRDPNWPAAALEAQAIAARTYALWTVRSGRELCPTDACQVYLGAQAEYAAMNQAVRETRGQVVTYDGALVQAVYSANHAGLSGTAAEGFGPTASEMPYLVPVAYPNADPVAETIRMELADVARRVGYAGDLATVKVTQVGPSGRALEVTLDGSAGPKSVDGVSFWAALALPSTLYTLHQEGADDGAPTAGTGGERVAAPPPAPATVATTAASAPPDGPWVPVAVGALLASAVATRGVARNRKRRQPQPAGGPVPSDEAEAV